MPNERTTSWGKWGVALLPALSGRAMADLREGIRLPGFYVAEETEPKTPVWFFPFKLLPWLVEQHEFAKSESNVYLSSVAMKTKQWSLSLWSGTHPVHPRQNERSSSKVNANVSNQCLDPPAKNGLSCIRRSNIVCHFPSASRRSWVLYFQHDKMSYWACLNLAPSQEGVSERFATSNTYTTPHPLKIVVLM